MRTYSYKIFTEKGWSKRGVRITAENANEATKKGRKFLQK